MSERIRVNIIFESDELSPEEIVGYFKMHVSDHTDNIEIIGFGTLFLEDQDSSRSKI